MVSPGGESTATGRERLGRDALGFARKRRLRQVERFAVDLGELDPKQTALDAHAWLALLVTFLEGEQFGIDVGDPEADEHGLFGRDIGLQALDDLLRLGAAHPAVEFRVADIFGAASHRGDGACQKLLALLLKIVEHPPGFQEPIFAQKFHYP